MSRLIPTVRMCISLAQYFSAYYYDDIIDRLRLCVQPRIHMSSLSRNMKTQLRIMPCAGNDTLIVGGYLIASLFETSSCFESDDKR